MLFGRIKRSAELFKQAWSVLKSEPGLVLFPILSGAALLVVVASFALPIVLSDELLGAFRQVMDSADSKRAATASGDSAASTSARLIVWSTMFAVYLVTSVVTIFFNAALFGAADKRLRGEASGVREGLAIAMQRLPQILGWALVSAIIGTILRCIEERVGFVGKFVIGFIGLAWAIGTYFVIPALVLDGVGPIEAVKRSAHTIKKTWGEGLVLAIGFGAIGFVVTLVCLMFIIAGVVLGVVNESAVLGVAVGSCGVLLMIAWSLVASTLGSIVQVALYRYALDGTVLDGFDAGALKGAFALKKAPKTAKA